MNAHSHVHAFTSKHLSICMVTQLHLDTLMCVHTPTQSTFNNCSWWVWGLTGTWRYLPCARLAGVRIVNSTSENKKDAVCRPERRYRAWTCCRVHSEPSGHWVSFLHTWEWSGLMPSCGCECQVAFQEGHNPNTVMWPDPP